MIFVGFGGLGVDGGASEGSWKSFWGAKWLKGGWLEGWLVVAVVGLDAGWGVAWARGLLEPREPLRVGLDCSLWGQNQHIYQETNYIST